VVQQGGGAGLQHAGVIHQTIRSDVTGATGYGRVIGGPVVSQYHTAAPKIQRAPKEGEEESGERSGLLSKFADFANLIPGFRMFTILLGVNPLTMIRVERSPANILRALVEFLPGGFLITQALDSYGLIEKAGSFVEKQIANLGVTFGSIKKSISMFLDSLNWKDIFRPGDVWARAKRIFTDPIDRIINFAKGLVTTIITMVKDAILIPLAKLAEKTRGYDLLKAILGKDPITGEPFPRTADTLIGGFMKLIGKEEVWNDIKKAKAVERAFAWFQKTMVTLVKFVSQIPSLFIQALKSLELSDIILVPKAFAKLVNVFGTFIVNFISWAGEAVWNLLEIILDVVAPGIIPYLKKAAGTLRIILKNPLRFVGNLIKAGKQGLMQFAERIGTHLKNSLIQWVTGALGGTGIYIPQSFSIQEVVKFVLSVLGLTWQNVRQKLVKVIGERAVKTLETGFDLVMTLVTQGPAAAWQKIQESLSNLKDMVMEGIISFVVDGIVKKAISMLVKMLNPVVGGIIELALGIYNTVMFFIERFRQIAQVAASFIDSIAAIASGAIAAAADRVEKTLAGLLTLAISFLARLAGLGKISEAVIKIINKIRAPVDKAMDRVIDWIVSAAKKVGKLIVTGAKDVAGRVMEWWKTKKEFKTVSGESHETYFTGEVDKARLMIKSNTPQFLEDFLNKAELKEENKKGARQNAIKIIRKQLDILKASISKGQGDITSVDNMLPHLKVLMGSDELGTLANPFRIQYTKRRSILYCPLYLGPQSTDPIPQKKLKDAMAKKPEDRLKLVEKYIKPSKENIPEWKKKNYEIEKYEPHESKSLPVGSDTLGLTEKWQIDVGKIFRLIPGKTKGGSLINQKLEPFGYRAGKEGRDGDHVLEMQLGGENVLENLWPLELSENRSSGGALASMPIEKTNMEALKDKTENQEVWMVIAETKKSKCEGPKDW
jgi:TusA-related sulfurtransferase